MSHLVPDVGVFGSDLLLGKPRGGSIFLLVALGLLQDIKTFMVHRYQSKRAQSRRGHEISAFFQPEKVFKMQLLSWKEGQV